jgi:hypothetical protein
MSSIYLSSNPTLNPHGNYFTDFVSDAQRVIDQNVTQYPGGFWWVWGEMIPIVGNGYATFSLGSNVSYVFYPLTTRN